MNSEDLLKEILEFQQIKKSLGNLNTKLLELENSKLDNKKKEEIKKEEIETEEIKKEDTINKVQNEEMRLK